MLLPLTGFELPASGAAGSPGAGAEGGAGANALDGAGGSPAEQDDTGAPLDPTDFDGELVAGIWDDNLNFEHFQSSQSHPSSGEALKFTPDAYQAAHDASTQAKRPRQTIDIALVLDTTGSMVDELVYLNDHIGELWDGILEGHPAAAPNFALVVYRDEGDDYLSRSFDFTPDKAGFKQLLAQQQAAGGGDLPEAAEVALAEMNELSWRSDETTRRVAFWFTDAPHRVDAEARLLQVVQDARQNNVVIYPVASSNVDLVASFSLRNVAQYTGGRYVFITTFSQTVQTLHPLTPPCFYVTTLGTALTRVISIELTGEYQAPQASALITAHSKLVSGVCNTEFGTGLAF
jgi:hypothetical protein